MIAGRLLVLIVFYLEGLEVRTANCRSLGQFIIFKIYVFKYREIYL